jgi:Fe-S cluster biogenesis protein NfuA
MLNEQGDGPQAAVEPVGTVPSNDLFDIVQSALNDLRGHLRRDGGDIELIAVEGDMVVVDLKGTCVGCMLSSLTLGGIRKRLIEMTGKRLRVVPLSATALRRPVQAVS